MILQQAYWLRTRHPGHYMRPVSVQEPLHQTAYNSPEPAYIPPNSQMMRTPSPMLHNQTQTTVAL